MSAHWGEANYIGKLLIRQLLGPKPDVRYEPGVMLSSSKGSAQT